MFTLKRRHLVLDIRKKRIAQMRLLLVIVILLVLVLMSAPTPTNDNEPTIGQKVEQWLIDHTPKR